MYQVTHDDTITVGALGVRFLLEAPAIGLDHLPLKFGDRFQGS